MYKSHPLLLLVMLLTSSCVGTVEDAKLKMNDLFNQDTMTLNFDGIESVRPVSHNKIELEFNLATISDSNTKYFLYINDGVNVIQISPESVEKAPRGRGRYMVDNLNINTTYKFRMRLRNILTKAESKNEREETAKTFDNRTANFKGVTSVSKVNGQSDTTIKVDWSSATMEGSTAAGSYDPYYYEVQVIGPGGPENMNNPDYVTSDKKAPKRVPDAPTVLSPFNYTTYTSTVINGLLPNTQYYVQVRAVNRLYDTYDASFKAGTISSIPVNKEVNTKFLSITTDPTNGSFDFTPDSFLARSAPSDAYKSRIDSNWFSASGTYVGYQLFYIPCSSVNCTATSTVDQVLAVDLLDDATIDNIKGGTLPVGAGYKSYNILDSTKTSYQLPELIAYTWYQLKLVACKTTACSKGAGTAIHSTLRAVRTAPTLAAFTGISKVDHPESALATDQVTLKYDVPEVTVGYADTMEFFCVDPASVAAQPTAGVPVGSFVQMKDNSFVTGKTDGLSQCNGLRICGPTSSDCDANQLNNYSLSKTASVKIKGIKTDGTNYCFAAFPAIRSETEQLPSGDSTRDWLVRCITPTVKTPTIAEFPGISGQCTPVENRITVNWARPLGGIFSKFRVFWRKIAGNETFTFAGATGAVVDGTINTTTNGYYASGELDETDTTFLINDLRPGTRYKVGILTQTVSATPSEVKWSEFNTTVRDCMTEMPRFEFNEWTRVFAIGPKTDGRFPHANTLAGIRYNSNASLYEALNADGIPYEVGLNNTDGTPDFTVGFNSPPGQYPTTNYQPTGFTSDFDGAFGVHLGQNVAASNKGIVSLAWSEVKLNFLNEEFIDCQAMATETLTNSFCLRDATGNEILPTNKAQRRYGYKVYRSADNRMTWKDVTIPTSGLDNSSGSNLIYAKSFNYYKRPGQDKVTNESMAFFTDYSVESIVANPTTTARGRILWYKIVPYFDNKPITITNSQNISVTPPNVIKVILPPANMALVHRMMSNRQACIELGRDDTSASSFKKDINYACDYNGFGAQPKGAPWKTDNSGIDLGGHLLVDRFELGCNYTRGDAQASTVSNGSSYYFRPGIFGGLTSWLTTFKGFATDTLGVDKSNNFQGCAAPKAQPWSFGGNTLEGLASNPLTATITNYRNFIHGDCLGGGFVRMSPSACTDNLYAYKALYIFPGASFDRSLNPGSLDCSANTEPNEPNHAGTMLDSNFIKNVMIQSEFAGVYHHVDRSGSSGSGIYPNPQGPNGNTLNWSNDEANWGKRSSCNINLASIGSDGNWNARWYGASDLELVRDGAGNRNALKDAVSIVKANPNFYNGTSFKVPEVGFDDIDRYTSTTRLGRVLSSNSAKLPPITDISPTAAQALCETYDVDVGFSSDGSNFLSWSFPQPKRLLGRRELVSAGAWPDSDGSSGTTDYDEATITALENGGAGMCVNSNKSIGYLDYATHGTAMTATMPKRDHSASGNFSPMKGPAVLFTGSSSNDGNIHSGLCTSRYGIQDLIGNVAESTTDLLFCDYGSDKLFFGRFAGDGLKDYSIELPPYNTENEITVWTGATVTVYSDTSIDGATCDPAPGGGFDCMVVNGNTTKGQMWAESPSTSGYCSIVDGTDPGATYSTQNRAQRYTDPNGTFYSIFQADGVTLNPNIFEPNTSNFIYQKNVNKLRNGNDGYFLSFGDTSPGPQLRYNDSLAITSEGGLSAANGALQGRYFNPIIGMSLGCKSAGTCDGTDNIFASTNYFLSTAANNQNVDVINTITFPIGNSQIRNLGVSEAVYRRGSAIYSINMADPAAWRNNRDSVIVGMKKGKTAAQDRLDIESWSTFVARGLAGLQNFSSLQYVIPRGDPLHILHGGSANQAKTGRYSANIVNGERLRSQRGNDYPGVRCGVMIFD